MLNLDKSLWNYFSNNLKCKLLFLCGNEFLKVAQLLYWSYTILHVICLQIYHYCISISGKINSTWFAFHTNPHVLVFIDWYLYAVFVILGLRPNRKQYRHCTCMCVSRRPCFRDHATTYHHIFSGKHNWDRNTLQRTGTLHYDRKT